MADTTENCNDDDIGVLMPNVMKLLHAEMNSEVSSVLQHSVSFLIFQWIWTHFFPPAVELISIGLAEES